MKNNKVSIDLDLEDLFGLKENTNTLEYDLNFIIDNCIDKYLEKQQEEKTKDKEFMELFKRNYNNINKKRELPDESKNTEPVLFRGSKFYPVNEIW